MKVGSRRFVTRSGFLAAIAAALIVWSCGQPSPIAPTRASIDQTVAPGATTQRLGSLTTTWDCFTGGNAGIFASADPCSPIRTGATRLSAAAMPGAPSTPSGLTPSVSGTTVTLTWTFISGLNPNATSFVVEAGSSSGRSDLANFDTGGTAMSLTVEQVPGGTYFVRVRAKNLSGLSDASNEVIVAVSGGVPCAAPATPGGLSASVNGSTVNLTWAAASGAASYVLEAGSLSGASNLANFDTGSRAASLTANGVAAGTYFVRVRAKSACSTSAASNEVTVSVSGGGTLTGRWVGLAPDGFIVSDPQSCDSAEDIQMDITQSGTTLTGTQTSSTRALTPGRNCGVIGFVATTSFTGTVSGSAVTVTIPQEHGQTLTLSLTLTGNRLSGSGVGYPATLAVTRQ
jgi:hypothetical protein